VNSWSCLSAVPDARLSKSQPSWGWLRPAWRARAAFPAGVKGVAGRGCSVSGARWCGREDRGVCERRGGPCSAARYAFRDGARVGVRGHPVVTKLAPVAPIRGDGQIEKRCFSRGFA
jgi:hypothetical protein